MSEVLDRRKRQYLGIHGVFRKAKSTALCVCQILRDLRYGVHTGALNAAWHHVMTGSELVSSTLKGMKARLLRRPSLLYHTLSVLLRRF
jgi:hypothetical protein